MGVDDKFLKLQVFTEQFGILHELQVKQLQMWIRIAAGDFFDDYEIGWEGEEKLVRYTLMGVRFEDAPPNLDRRLSFLHQSIQWLLGTDYALEVVRDDGTVIYDRAKPQEFTE